jgi:hypothetical protein
MLGAEDQGSVTCILSVGGTSHVGSRGPGELESDGQCLLGSLHAMTMHYIQRCSCVRPVNHFVYGSGGRSGGGISSTVVYN